MNILIFPHTKWKKPNPKITEIIALKMLDDILRFFLSFFVIFAYVFQAVWVVLFICLFFIFIYCRKSSVKKVLFFSFYLIFNFCCLLLYLDILPPNLVLITILVGLAVKSIMTPLCVSSKLRSAMPATP